MHVFDVFGYFLSVYTQNIVHIELYKYYLSSAYHCLFRSL